VNAYKLQQWFKWSQKKIVCEEVDSQKAACRRPEGPRRRTQRGWVKEGSSLHCFRGVKGRLTARLVRGRPYQELRATRLKEWERKRESGRGSKRGRGLERCRGCSASVNAKWTVRVNSPSVLAVALDLYNPGIITGWTVTTAVAAPGPLPYTRD